MSKKLVWIYSDIHSYNFFDTNIFGHSFASKFSRMSHSALKQLSGAWYMIICHTWGLFKGSQGYRAQNSTKMALHDHKWPKWPYNSSQGHNTWLYVILDHSRASVGLWKSPRWSNMAYNHVSRFFHHLWVNSFITPGPKPLSSLTVFFGRLGRPSRPMCLAPTPFNGSVSQSVGQ